MSPMKALIIAEAIAQQHGDSNLFKEVYTNYRAKNDVLQSIELSLKFMGLYDVFAKYNDLR